MSKTTITINGEECVILPAPKGAFILKDGDSFPYFVPYIAVRTTMIEYINGTKETIMYALCISYGKSLELLSTNQYPLRTDVFDKELQKLYEGFKEVGDYDLRKVVICLYQLFTHNQTSISPTAIEWFKEKFKEHNITKADFDVFA